MDTVEEDILNRMITLTNNVDVKKGLQAALEVVQSSGYYNYDDYFSQSDEECNELAETYLDL